MELSKRFLNRKLPTSKWALAAAIVEAQLKPVLAPLQQQVREVSNRIGNAQINGSVAKALVKLQHAGLVTGVVETIASMDTHGWNAPRVIRHKGGVIGFVPKKPGLVPTNAVELVVTEGDGAALADALQATARIASQRNQMVRDVSVQLDKLHTVGRTIEAWPEVTDILIDTFKGEIGTPGPVADVDKPLSSLIGRHLSLLSHTPASDAEVIEVADEVVGPA